MKCPECETPDVLIAEVTLKIEAPFAKGGGINLSGITVSQATVKEEWTKSPIRYPITCAACGTEFHYVTGEKNALRAGPPPGLGEQLDLPLEGETVVEDEVEETE